MSSIQTPQLSVAVSPPAVNEELAKQIDYTQLAYRAPVYKYTQIQQTGGGGSSLTLSQNAQTQVLFNIPDVPFNPAQSYIMMDSAHAASAVSTNVNISFVDSQPIYTVRLKPANGGDAIVDVDNVQVWTKIVQPLSLSIDEYLSRQGVYGDSAIGTAYPISQSNGCQSYGALNTRSDGKFNTAVPGDAYITDSTLISRSAANASAVSGMSTDERSPQRLANGVAYAVGPPVLGATTIRYKIPFSAFVGTLLAMDRTVSFAQVMQLYLFFQPVVNFGFAANIPVDNATVPANQSALATPTISNFYLYLAVDRSDTGAEIALKAHTSGITFYMPYTVSTMFTPAAAGIQDVPVILTPGTGSLLKRIITVVTSNATTGINTANTDNVAGVKWTQVRSYMDSSALFDYPFALSDGTLYNYMKPFLSNTAAGIGGQRGYEANCFYMDNFSDCNDGSQFPDNDLKASGLAVRAQRNYSARFTLVQGGAGGGNNRLVYIFQVWLRQLVVKPTGISWLLDM